MDKRVLLLSLLLSLAPSIASAQAPTLLDRWSTPRSGKLHLGPEGDIYAGHDTGVIRYTPDGAAVQSWDALHLIDFAVTPEGDLFVALWKAGTSNIRRLGADGEVIAAWSSQLGGRESTNQVMGIAVDSDGLVYVLDEGYKRVARFTPEGEPVDHWTTADFGSGISFPSCILIANDGNVIVGGDNETGYGRMRTYTPEGVRLNSWTDVLSDGKSFYPTDVAQDRWGNVYISDDIHYSILVYRTDGRTLGHFSVLESITTGVVVDDQGDVYVADGPTISKFGPYGPAFDPVQEPAVMLHVRPAETLEDPCLGAPSSIEDIVTEGQGDPSSGGSYYVYVLGSPQKYIGDQSGGINGFQFGIDYHRTGGQSEQAIRIHEWTQCAGLEFPQDAWPATGAGNTITWGIGDCQADEIVTAGFFYLSAYSPSRMSVVGFPVTDQVKVANCLGAEMEAQAAVSPIRLGWVALEASGGCNPLLEPCYGATPVERTTWGSLKTRFTGAQTTADKPRPR